MILDRLVSSFSSIGNDEPYDEYDDQAAEPIGEGLFAEC